MAKRFWAWISGTESQGTGSLLQGFGSVLQGLGTLALGIGAIIALSKTDEVLNRILEIKKLSEDTNQGIARLESELKAGTANRAIDSSPALKSPKPSRPAIEKALSFIPSFSTPGASEVILPKSRREETVDLLLKTNDVNVRKQILMNSLEYVPGTTPRQHPENIEPSHQFEKTFTHE